MDHRRESGITPDMTVREVNIAHPQAMAVFEKYGIAGCGGRYGPPESLKFFAQAHKVDCAQLIEDVEKAIRGDAVETEAMGRGNIREESTLYRHFVKAAIVCVLTAGAASGLLILGLDAVRGGLSLLTLSLSQAHASVQVYGWVGLFIMGFAYHAIPRFKNAPLQYGQTTTLALVLVIVSLLMRFIAQPLIQRGPIFSGLLVSSGILLLTAYASFFISMVVTVRRSGSETEFYEKFIVASLVWGLVSVLINLSITLSMVDDGVPLIRPGTDEILRHVQFFGFIAMMILGVSYRILPGFLGLGESDRKSAGWTFLSFNLGIALWLVGSITAHRSLSVIGSGFELLATLLAIHSLNIFRRRESPIEIGGDAPLFSWYIRLSFLWLVLALVMVIGGDIYGMRSMFLLPHAYVDAYRHLIAMGFVTTMIMGIAQRILPVWEGKVVYSAALMSWVFILLLIGNTLRTLVQATGIQITVVGRLAVSGGGIFQFASFVLFSYNIWRTLDLEGEPLSDSSLDVSHRSVAEMVPPSRFGPKMKVFEILHEYPGAAAVLEDLGIRGLPGGEDGKGVPKFLTLERLCKSSGVELNRVVAALEDHCAGESGMV